MQTLSGGHVYVVSVCEITMSLSTESADLQGAESARPGSVRSRHPLKDLALIKDDERHGDGTTP